MEVVNRQVMHLCSFSDFKTPLNEYPKSLKGNSLHKWILKRLKHRKRISCWEIDSDMRMCRTLMYLEKINKIKLDTKRYDYPYVGITVN